MSAQQQPPARRSVRLSREEAWERIAAAHTGIAVTLRRDGQPIALPTWFVVVDGAICFRTPAHTKKVARLRNDPRISFLIEAGERWEALTGVHVTGRVELVDAASPLAERISTALDEKYAAHRMDKSRLVHSESRSYYQDNAPTFIRIIADARVLNWDNSRLEIAAEGSSSSV